MNLKYVVGDATDPIIKDGIRVIPHVNNDIGAWGHGFVISLSKKFNKVGSKYQSPEYLYKRWIQNGINQEKDSAPFKLGQIQFAHVDRDLYVCNMIAQSGCGDFMGLPPIRYQSLEECLLRMRSRIEKAIDAGKRVSIHSPRFGAFLAGGKWEIIEEIILRVFKDVNVDWYVYDLPKGK